MKKSIIATEKAPAAIGPYSQAVCVNGIVATSGQLPIDPATGKLVEGGIQEQTRQCFRNLAAILEEANGKIADMVKEESDKALGQILGNASEHMKIRYHRGDN